MNLTAKLKNAKFVQRFFITLAVSLLIIIAGIVMTCVKGMNLGIEFTGGIKISVDANDASDVENVVTKWLEGDRGVDADGNTNNPNDKKFVIKTVTKNGNNYVFILGTTMTENGKSINMLTERVKFNSGSLEDEEGYVAQRESQEINRELNDYLEEKYNGEVTATSAFVGNESAKWILKSAIIAVAVAIAVILVYIALRFTLISGLASILALIHNVLIMFACTAIFRIAVNQTFIAAIVTIIGYSINSTIVVFDKIRELLKRPSYADVNDTDIANEAIGLTLKRTLLTTLTTLVMIALLAVFGTQAIREFAYPIIFGLFAGAYSSVLLAAPTWVYLRKLFKQADKKPVKKKKKATKAENTAVAENA